MLYSKATGGTLDAFIIPCMCGCVHCVPAVVRPLQTKLQSTATDWPSPKSFCASAQPPSDSGFQARLAYVIRLLVYTKSYLHNLAGTKFHLHDSANTKFCMHGSDSLVKQDRLHRRSSGDESTWRSLADPKICWQHAPRHCVVGNLDHEMGDLTPKLF